ncbi:non-ribosomal peptide synthetase [Paenibacillus pini]|uniref:Long-chain-fatty-acid-CoA ligase n=1 Tax=Paenibacillus pini JCM 16418 TaxID=1236976 RepID=W7Y672_9BACL|nr:non-ribosomal peptide synthetase [Paenibacillus pini]GAF06370.1 long-chain-fatty-acid-CoA ligase [Paenibacillus pini JCM 16418]
MKDQSGVLSEHTAESHIGSKYNEERAYWLKELSGPITMGGVPSEVSENLDEVGKAHRKQLLFTLPESLSTRLLQVSGNSDFATYVVLAAALVYILFRYSGKKDFILGMPPFRNEPSERPLAAIRARIDGKMSFKELLSSIKHSCLGAKKYKNVSMNTLLPQLDVERLSDSLPLFRSMAAFRGVHEWNESSQTSCDFIFSNSGSSIQFEILYHCGLYQEEAVERLAAHFIQVLEQTLYQPDIPLHAIQMLTREELELMQAQNHTAVEYDTNRTLDQLFEEQVQETPDAIAIIFDRQPMSYSEINQRSNQIAWMLLEKGVSPGDRVGLMVRRGFNMVTGIIAVLKAGASYVPMDPDFPSERIRYMLEDSQSRLLLTESDCLHNFGEQDSENEQIRLDQIHWSTYSTITPPCLHRSEDLAYLIYTSGSTGQPKGVMIEHQSVHNFAVGMKRELGLTHGKRILNLTTISFDIFVLETLVPLICGMTVVIAPEKAQKDPLLLSGLIEDTGVEMLQMTPSRLQLFLASGLGLSCFEQLTDIMIGGEDFPQMLADRLAALTKARIYNMYGPTETTVWSAIERIYKGTAVSLGNPIANTQLYIVDEFHSLQPAGIEGELCIGGDGLARGYWGREGLTMDKFVPNPFDPGTLMYNTGDLARRLSDGRIIFLGRKDFQVKIRGYRIELGEIEQVLSKMEGIHSCAVAVSRNGSGDPVLTAYYSGDAEQSSYALRSWLSATLPDYMIPGQFMYLEEMPMTLNGKLDRGRLPSPDSLKGLLHISADERPQTEVEEAIRQIWTDILKREEISIYDNFFEIGGNSTLIVMVYAKLEQLYPATVQVADLFTYPTIATLAECITRSSLSQEEYVVPSFILGQEYLHRLGEEAETDVLEVSVPQQFYSEAIHAAESRNADLFDLTAMAFIYSLAEAADCGDLSISYLRQGERGIHPLYVDFLKIETMEELLGTVREQRLYMKQQSGFLPSKQGTREGVEGEGLNRPIRAAFVEGTDRKLEASELTDLHLSVELVPGGIRLVYEFNSRTLRQSGVENIAEKFISCYQQIINLLSGKEELYA